MKGGNIYAYVYMHVCVCACVSVWRRLAGLWVVCGWFVGGSGRVRRVYPLPRCAQVCIAVPTWAYTAPSP